MSWLLVWTLTVSIMLALTLVTFLLVQAESRGIGR